MKRAVLEFQRGRVKMQHADADSIDIVETLADLHEDLQCIERVINAVERLAVARMGEDARKVRRKPASRRKKTNTSTAKRKGGLVVLGRLPRTYLP